MLLIINVIIVTNVYKHLTFIIKFTFFILKRMIILGYQNPVNFENCVWVEISQNFLNIRIMQQI